MKNLIQDNRIEKKFLESEIENPIFNFSQTVSISQKLIPETIHCNPLYSFEINTRFPKYLSALISEFPRLVLSILSLLVSNCSRSDLGFGNILVWLAVIFGIVQILGLIFSKSGDKQNTE
ncbi:MAG: hypothetical protein IPL26_19535 [Leptospiraceae bacterium]|nr:hypothetical protein [Leptospiraceae bacterium]